MITMYLYWGQSMKYFNGISTCLMNISQCHYNVPLEEIELFIKREKIQNLKNVQEYPYIY